MGNNITYPFGNWHFHHSIILTNENGIGIADHSQKNSSYNGQIGYKTLLLYTYLSNNTGDLKIHNIFNLIIYNYASVGVIRTLANDKYYNIYEFTGKDYYINTSRNLIDNLLDNNNYSAYIHQ